MQIIIENLKEAAVISVFVFSMMLFTDYLNVLSRGKFNQWIKGGKPRQYIISSFLGATPGCLGAFMNVSFYIHGLISFGAVVGGMIATSGDEAFVMLAMFPKKALFLFFILFILGIVFAYLADKLIPFLKIRLSQECELSGLHLEEECRCLTFKEAVEQIRKISLQRFLLLFLLGVALGGFLFGFIGPRVWGWKRITFVLLLSLASFVVIGVPEHYLEEHIWKHIAKKHLWRIFLWSFFALLLVNAGLKFWNLEAFVKAHMLWVLLIASLVGVVPESGPHLIFVMMFAKGMIPFSVILASSIVQDGHGMLPLLSYSLRDSFLIKLFNLVIGLGVGFLLYLAGF
ncbi:MAG: arsenic efflux protein [Candidatus Omnitrophica bacterium]|nr:arsenic efflux protein [Candidatus Omnitrophota bacterium]